MDESGGAADGSVVATWGGGGGDFNELEGVVAIFLREKREHPLYVGEGADGAADAVVVRDEGVDNVGDGETVGETVGGCDEG